MHLLLPAAILLTALVASLQGQQQPSEQPPRFGVRVDLVSLDVEVLDRGGDHVTDLTRDDFLVTEDGRAMEISHFAWLSDRPVSLVVVLDTSAIPRDKLSIAKDMISRISHLLAREDEIALYSFDNRDAYLEQDFTSDRAPILAALSNIDVVTGRGGSILKDLFGAPPRTGLGIDLALLNARKGRHEKKAILVISNRFKGLGPATIDHVREAGYTLLALRFSNKTNSIATLGGDAIMRRRLLEQSGGRQFSADTDDVTRTCRAVAWSLKNHYSLAYQTRTSEGGKPRSIQVSVPGRGYIVHARRGYVPSR